MSEVKPRSAHYPYIDGLRAIAVISVILYHLKDSYLPGGFSGVDVFFVISGFVVSLSMANFQGRNFFTFVTTFYARRMKRILPALLFCVLLTALVSAMFIPGSWLSDTNQRAGLYALFGLSNFVLAATGNDYFSPKTDFNPFTHTWSLAVEEQFYFVFPILFFVWVAFKNLRWLSTGLFVTGLVASLIWASQFSAGRETSMFYMLAPRFWELAAGVLLYQAMARYKTIHAHRPATLASSAGVLLGLALIACAAVISVPAKFPFPGAVLPVIGLLCVIAFGHGRTGGVLMGALSHRIPVFIGKISYSLYLWHWAVFVLFRWTVGLETIPTQIAALVLCVCMALLSYRFIELPLRHGGWLSRMPNYAVMALGLVVLAGSYKAYLLTLTYQPQLTQSTVSQHPLDWYPYGRESSAASPGCVPLPVAKNVNGNLVLVYSRGGCDKPATWNFKLFVVGDSHAMAYVPMLTQLVMDTGVEVHLYNNGGCPFMSFQTIRETEQCKQNSIGSLNDIAAQAQGNDVVFLPSLRLARFADQYAHFSRTKTMNEMFGPEAVAGRTSLEANAPDYLAPVLATGAKVVFEAPKPIFEITPFRCSDWFNRSNAACKYGDAVSKKQLEEYRQPVTELMSRLAEKVPAISVWDPLPTLCPDTECHTLATNGRPLFFDADHVSGYGNMLLTPDFQRFISNLKQQHAGN
ncbi:O-antigen acetylase, putative [Paucimonas lemoignei]|nr:O-antigen acetylase, putative [Paucimonas lemoignei]